MNGTHAPFWTEISLEGGFTDLLPQGKIQGICTKERFMVSVIELKESALVWQIERLAKQTVQPVEAVLATAVETYLDQLDRDGICAETQAFRTMQDQLIAQYPGQHVAIYGRNVVDHDTDAARLEYRVRQRFGLLPVLIAPVQPDGRQELQWRGGRLDIAGGQ